VRGLALKAGMGSQYGCSCDAGRQFTRQLPAQIGDRSIREFSTEVED